MKVCTLTRGTTPLLISLPHDGTGLPPELEGRLTPEALRLPDTDWHVARLYEFAVKLGASMLVPRFSRYLVDLNRPPDNASLYPGQNTTGLCPTSRFDGAPLYRDGQEPGAAELAERIERYWQPYHDVLADELAHLRAIHGGVVLWEGHSIRGELPFLFEGCLPDLSLGTMDGLSCSVALQARLEHALGTQQRYSWVANGRFKGGYITRHYGMPDSGIEAVQLEIAQRTYMDEHSFAYREDLAAELQQVLGELLYRCL